MKKTLLTLATAVAFNTYAQVTLPESPDWDLTPIYANWDQWQQEKQRLTDGINQISQFQGKLGDSQQLLQALTLYYDTTKNLSRLYNYASLSADTDLRNAENSARRNEMGLLYSRFSELSSYLNPEIIALGQAKIDRLIGEQPKLQSFRFPLQQILDAAPHTLDAKTEALLAATGPMARGASNSFNTLLNTEIQWLPITLDDETKPLNTALFNQLRNHPDRQVRKEVFDTFYTSLGNYQRTLASTLNTQMNTDVFYAKARNYPNALAAALADDAIPEQVYRQLVQTTNDNLDTLHRYLKLRGRMLGIEQLQYYDIYASIGDSSVSFPIDQGVEMMLASLAPMGSEYTGYIASGLEQGWMDTYPKEGKRGGAYMSGSTYDVHPYVLMNYNDSFSEVSTLTHEWGHAIHSVYSNQAQPWHTSGYSIFVAEIAAIFQEHLLADYVKNNTADDDQRLFFLGQMLETFRGTYFRQTMFAEFELAIHEAVERGESLSDARINGIYLDILRRYHGHDQGVMKIDETYATEWSRVPHFYYNFYVFNYATSVAASAQFAQNVVKDKAAYDRYLTLLKAGGSDYPYELVKTAGVDLAKAEPYEALMTQMNLLMDEIERILDKQGK